MKERAHLLIVRVIGPLLMFAMIGAYCFGYFSSSNLIRTRPEAPEASSGYVVKLCSVDKGPKRCVYVSVEEAQSIRMAWAVGSLALFGLIAAVLLYKRSSNGS